MHIGFGKSQKLHQVIQTAVITEGRERFYRKDIGCVHFQKYSRPLRIWLEFVPLYHQHDSIVKPTGKDSIREVLYLTLRLKQIGNCFSFCSTFSCPVILIPPTNNICLNLSQLISFSSVLTPTPTNFIIHT